MKKKEAGLKFQWMTGHGTISCGDCDFSQELTLFTHGYHESDEGLHKCITSGFQCQSCGQFSTRKRVEPFVKSAWEEAFEILPNEERADRIEHMQSMKKMCERYMKEKPKEQWLGTWEPTVTEYTKVLNTVPPEELKAIKEKREEFKRQYAATLFCDNIEWRRIFDVIKKYHYKAFDTGYKNIKDASTDHGCGGRLEKEKILFCPLCKSKNLKYDMVYMT